MDAREKERFMELLPELEPHFRAQMLEVFDAIVHPDQEIQVEIEQELEDAEAACEDPTYRAERALERCGYLPTEHGERMMEDPLNRAAFGREILNDLPKLEGKHLMAVGLLIGTLARKCEAPTPEA